MKVLTIYARLYGECFVKTLAGIGKNVWTLLLPLLLLFALELAGAVLHRTGMVGGIILSLLRSALLGSYLYFVGEVVQQSRVGLGDFGTSIRVYFWSLINLFFVLWIVDLVLQAVIPNPRTQAITSFAIDVLVFVILPSLEVIYLRGAYGGLATLQRAFGFMQESWIEWVIPNLPFFLLAWRVTLGGGLIPEYPWAERVVLSVLLHLAMVFRGHVFNALDGSSHRQRMFKYRNQLT